MTDTTARTIAIIGGGFSGALLALRLAAAPSVHRVLLIERDRRIGVGLAYGACAPHHLLNVPVARLEVDLTPRFADWLAARADFTPPYGAPLADAFAPRALYGSYLEARVAEATGPALQRIRGECVRIADAPRRVVLRDGRAFEADTIVLAVGNAPPAPLTGGDDLHGPGVIPDPWAHDAFDGLDDGDPVLLVGTGLTMVDVALNLDARGHRGPIVALSRRGLLPTRHQAGGAWSPFLADAVGGSARAALRMIRREVDRAAGAGVPWQRVMDAARPDVARLWRSWSIVERRRFLRHLRARWDVHRHRMAPAVADTLDRMLARGQLQVHAGRIRACAARGGAIDVTFAPPGRGDLRHVRAQRIFNCTGPRSDLAQDESPLIADLRRRGLARADPLGLGLDTEDGALTDTTGAPSRWLFAVGPLTRSALWEVTAVPEIRAQVDALAARLADPGDISMRVGDASLSAAFADLGAGI